MWLENKSQLTAGEGGIRWCHRGIFNLLKEAFEMSIGFGVTKPNLII